MTDFLLTPDILRKCFPNASSAKVSLFVEHLNKTFQRFQINTPQRIRMFLAQIGHESGELRYQEELASGRAYEGRKDLGNDQPGDGVRYKGRGLIQLTGKSNYTALASAMDLPLLEKPELLSTPELSALSAGWFFERNNLLTLCDKGDFKTLTRRINGGYNGMADRLRLLELANKHIPNF